MKKSTLNDYIIVNKIADHETHKSVLLDYFSKESKEFCHISNTDWENNKDKRRPWIYYFRDNIVSQITQKLNDRMNSLDMILHNIWFQQYNENDDHDWHNHIECQFTNVYYVELPKNQATEIFDFDVDINEGDVLTFPSFLYHRSKANLTKERKTIVSFNTCFNRMKLDKKEDT